MNKEETQKLLVKYNEYFLSEEGLLPVELTLSWKNEFSKEAGVYVLYRNGKIVYVGETGSLRGRLNDLRNTLNHTVRRNIGDKKYAKVNGYKKATSRIKFPDHIEKRVDRYLRGMKVKILPTGFGRKEIEEHLISVHDPVFNRKFKRGSAKSKKQTS